MRRATWNGPGCLYVGGEYFLPGVQFDADSIDPDALVAYCERPVGAPRAKLVDVPAPKPAPVPVSPAPIPVPIPVPVMAPTAALPTPVEPHAVISPVVPESELELGPAPAPEHVSKPSAHDKRKGKKR